MIFKGTLHSGYHQKSIKKRLDFDQKMHQKSQKHSENLLIIFPLIFDHF